MLFVGFLAEVSCNFVTLSVVQILKRFAACAVELLCRTAYCLSSGHCSDG